MERKFIIGANWKMNGNRELVEAISSVLNNADCPAVDIVVAPPAPLLALARAKFIPSIGISAQNCHQGISTCKYSFFWGVYGGGERRTFERFIC
jgi:triosephosphate isomerase